MKGIDATRIIQADGRLRVHADVNVNGFDRRRRQEQIPVTRLTAKDIDRELLRAPIEGHLPGGVPTTFKPKRSKRTHTLPVERGKEVDKGGTIFNTDNRYLFDYVVLIMEDRIGEIVGYPGYRSYDDDWNGGSYWQSIGYPGELSSGERPAFQGGGSISSVQNFSLSGQSGSVLGHFNDVTPGQSGGPAWGWWGSEPWPRVVGVGSTIGSTAVQAPTGSTNGDNEYGGGSALSALISWARANYP